MAQGAGKSLKYSLSENYMVVQIQILIQIQVGDVIRMENNSFIAADILLLSR